MERDMNNSTGTAAKTNPEALHAREVSVPAWGIPADDKRALSPAPPPEWTRYIDSRLKQFCTR
jgi:hypothetical protein